MLQKWLRRRMAGRYGPDQLCMALLVLAVVFFLLSWIPRARWLLCVSLFLCLLALYRFCSRDLLRRRRENDRFIRYWWPVRTKIRRFFRGLQERRTSRVFRCPQCRYRLQAPRGKGRVQLFCPQCGEKWMKRT